MRSTERGDGVHRKLFDQYGEAVGELEVRRAKLEETYLALVTEAEQ